MPQYSEHVIRPPEKTDTPFDQVVRGPLWTDSLLLDLWAGSLLRFCTDAECSELSGVPERSLRLLQTAGVIHATKAPLAGGSFKRVWLISEAAVASVIECLKRATNVDYATVAQIAFHAGVVTRMLFVDYLQMRQEHIGDEFGASLTLTNNRLLFLQINDALKDVDPELRKLSANGNLIPIAGIENGASKAVPEKRRQEFVAVFDKARFHVVVNLKNVFEQFERDARKMRT